MTPEALSMSLHEADIVHRLCLAYPPAADAHVFNRDVT